MNQLKVVRMNSVPEFKEINGIYTVSTLLIQNLLKIDLSDYEIISKEYINGFQLIDFAVHVSFSHSELMSELTDLVNLSKILASDLSENYFLAHAATETIIRNWHDSLPTEQDVNKWFVENYKSLIGEEFVIIKRKNDKSHIPDAWMVKESNYYPVEMKLHSFDKKALKQLHRYMENYDCSFGVAVGSNKECEIPENIIFVEHDICAKRRRSS